MHRTVRRAGLLPLLATVAWISLISGRPATDAGRLIAFEPYAPPGDALCEWPTATPAFAQQRGGGGGQRGRGGQAEDGPMGKPRDGAIGLGGPLRFIQDPNAAFSSIAVDPVRNEVVMTDENRFRIFVYDRLANTPPTGRTEPKRWIGGLNTGTQFSSGVYVDPPSGDIFVVNNDTVDKVTVYSRDKQGDSPPNRILNTVYGSFGIAADEEKQELFVTVQHSGAVMVFRKNAGPQDPAVRMILGPSTQMADAHGIAFDPINKVIYVSNWGTSREPRRDPSAPRTEYPRAAVPGSGKFAPPSITVYPADGDQDVAPLRVIQGSRADLNWPTSLSLDAKRGELYIANAGGDTIGVFSTSAQGDVAPIRTIKGSRTLLEAPTGVFVDVENDEVWVANFGNHTATVYPRRASGNVAPLRVIRSAPESEPTPLISNPYSIAYDAGRQVIIVPS